MLIIPFALVTLLVLAAIFNIIIQSMGYMPVFGLYDFTPGYYVEVLKRSEVLSSLLYAQLWFGRVRIRGLCSTQ